MPQPSLRRPGRGSVLGAAGLMALSMLTLTAGASSQGGTWGAVFTDAAVVGPPDWVQPGTRIVYYVASASVANSRYQLVEDPNGNLWNPRTGKHYRRTDESGEGVGSGSGDGYSVIDIVSVGPDQVVGAVSLYVMDHAMGTLSYLPIGGGPEPAGAMDAVWLHPRILEGLVAAGSAPGAELLVGGYPLGGVTYDVVALVSTSQNVSFDRASGLVLVGTGNAMGATLPVHLAGEDPPRGNSMLTYQRLLGVRQRTVPGTGAAVPDWLRPGVQLVFEGSYTMGVSLPSRTTFSYEQVGADWAWLRAVNEVSGMGTTSTNEVWAVSGGAGPYWYDPTALAGMRAGDVLDDDPTVGVRTRVADVGSWAGGDHVVMVTEGPGMQLWFDYDVATGVPLGYDVVQGVASTSVRLTAMP